MPHSPILISQIASREKIAERTADLAWVINSDYDGKGIIVVGVLNGAFVFMADLIRAIADHSGLRKCRIEATDFIGASSYGDKTKSSGSVIITKDLSRCIGNKNVLLVDDILDSGQTLRCLVDELKKRGPASIKTVVLLRKGTQFDKKPIEPDYIGFRIKNGFVVGYGLDYADRYRELPEIGILNPELIKD